MEVGNLKQRAHPFLVLFVFACAIVITGILYTKQKAEATRDNLIYLSHGGGIYIVEE